jgi:tyrosyl-tRNA synthetase
MPAITLPIITNREGDKFGKSAGNAVWLNEKKTSHFAFYQFFIRIPDLEVENLLKLLTFMPLQEIDELMKRHTKTPELREAQIKLAKEVTLLVHGQAGLEKAESISSALYQGNLEALGELSAKDVSQTFNGAPTSELLLEPGMTMLDVAMKIKCFDSERKFLD